MASGFSTEMRRIVVAVTLPPNGKHVVSTSERVQGSASTSLLVLLKLCAAAASITYMCVAFAVRNCAFIITSFELDHS